MNNTLGVLITYYNEKELLTECINSILEADDVPDEIIIYDDGSPSPAKLYLPSHPKIQLVRGDHNRGASYGRNHLLHLSKCEYVHFQDSDDLFAKTGCTELRKIIIQKHPDIILTQTITRYANTDIFALDFTPLKQTGDLIEYFIRYLTSTAMFTFRRELAIKIGGYQTDDLRAALDFYFNMKVALVASQFEVIEEPLVIARVRANSLTSDNDGAHRNRLSAKHLTSLINALSLLAPALPTRYHASAADVVGDLSSQLFVRGYYQEAREGFSIAYSMGIPTYKNKKFLHKFVAQNLNPMWAEHLSAFYRRMLPEKLRKRMRQS